MPYQITTHQGTERMTIYLSPKEVSALTRQDCITWLCANDRNGTYTDEDSRSEFGSVLTLEEARALVWEVCDAFSHAGVTVDLCDECGDAWSEGSLDSPQDWQNRRPIEPSKDLCPDCLSATEGGAA